MITLERPRGLTRQIDPRLEAICKPLLRKRRLDGRFLIPTRFEFPQAKTTDERQRAAVRALIEMACDVADGAPIRQLIMPRHERDELRADLEAALAKLRKCQDTLRRRGKDRLAGATEEIEKVLVEIFVRGHVVERDRGFVSEQAIARPISGIAMALFGQPLHDIVAKLTSALLGTEVTSRQVRQWAKIDLGG